MKYQYYYNGDFPSILLEHLYSLQSRGRSYQILYFNGTNTTAFLCTDEKINKFNNFLIKN